jgi:Ni,Fe-hydrogenase III large subunit
VAYAWSYCQALERMAGTVLPPRAAWLRALALELERIANHLGDLGALGNDAGFAVGLAQFSRLKEHLLRATEQALGQRYLLDLVVPGGTRNDLAPAGAAGLDACIAQLIEEVTVVRGIYEEHTGLRDRFAGAGAVLPDLAAWLGLVGLAGRASGQALDLRVDAACAPYDELAVRRCTQQDGDVLARVTLDSTNWRVSTACGESCVQCRPANMWEVPVPEPGSVGVGLIEAWRGPVIVGLEAGPGGSILRCHPQDPSWHNWPALEHAIIGNIVPDFPLINKSFNLSYAGQDL